MIEHGRIAAGTIAPSRKDRIPDRLPGLVPHGDADRDRSQVENLGNCEPVPSVDEEKGAVPPCRYGDLARSLGDREAMMGALAFHCADPARLGSFLDTAGVPQQARGSRGGTIHAVLEAFDTLIEFRPG